MTDLSQTYFFSLIKLDLPYRILLSYPNLTDILLFPSFNHFAHSKSRIYRTLYFPSHPFPFTQRFPSLMQPPLFSLQSWYIPFLPTYNPPFFITAAIFTSPSGNAATFPSELTSSNFIIQARYSIHETHVISDLPFSRRNVFITSLPLSLPYSVTASLPPQALPLSANIIHILFFLSPLCILPSPTCTPSRTYLLNLPPFSFLLSFPLLNPFSPYMASLYTLR